MIYLDQAATTLPKPAAVAEAMVAALDLGNSGRGAHHSSLAAGRVIYEARQAVAELLGAESSNSIVFTANATESLNLALYGLLNPGEHVITTSWEHNSVLRPLYLLEKAGVELSFISANSQGQLALTELPSYLRPNTKAIVCTHASNVTGDLVDLNTISQFCQEHNLLLIVDAAQTAGAFSLAVQEQNIAVLCFTGHKSLYGPQGIGGLYLRPDLSIKPLKVGGSGVQSFSPAHPVEMPEALEAGTLNTPGIAGLLAGIRYIKEYGLDTIRQTEEELTRHFYQGLQEIPAIQIYGDFTTFRRCPIIAVNLAGWDAGSLSHVLASDYEIYTRSGAHCAPLIHQALGTRERGVVRFSFSHLNTKQELNQALHALREIQQKTGRKQYV